MGLPYGVVERNKLFFLTGGLEDIELGRVQGPWGDRNNSFKVEFQCAVCDSRTIMCIQAAFYCLLAGAAARPVDTRGP